MNPRRLTLLAGLTLLALLTTPDASAQVRPPDAVDLKTQRPIRFTSARGVRLTRHSQRVVRTLASQLIEAWPDHHVWIIGHTDSHGSEEDNLDVSQRRAALVRELLVEYGINPTTITAQGRGEYEPLHPNTSRRGRRLNRRIDVFVVPAEPVEPATEPEPTPEPPTSAEAPRPGGLDVVLMSGVSTVTDLAKEGGTRSLYLRERVPPRSRVSTDVGAWLALRDPAGAVVLIGSQASVVLTSSPTPDDPQAPLTLDVLAGTVEVLQPSATPHALRLESAGVAAESRAHARVSLAHNDARVQLVARRGALQLSVEGGQVMTLSEGRAWCSGCDASLSTLLPAPAVISGNAPLDGQLSWRPAPDAGGYLVLFSYDPRQLHRVAAVHADDPWLDVDPELARAGLWWSVSAVDGAGIPGRSSGVFRVPAPRPSGGEPAAALGRLGE